MPNPLFFIGIIPPAEIAGEVMEFKRQSASKFDSRRALNSPAHITLFPPFRMSGQVHRSILSGLQEFSAKQDRFYVTLNGFGHFNNRVIFVDVEKNDRLQGLFNELGRFMEDFIGKDFSTRRFHPHATVAFRDLKPELFKPAWNYFSKVDYFRVFEVDNLYLLKHNGRVWELVNSFSLK